MSLTVNFCVYRYYGGFVAPNIYYLGAAGVIHFGNLTIGGLSGIYNENDYLKGHFERPPFNKSTIRSVYHQRQFDAYKLYLYSKPIDIFLSHDWPCGIYEYGDKQNLIQEKPFFRNEVSTRTLGSPALASLLTRLKPSFWFSAHLHVKFAALVPFDTDSEPKSITRFLALDKAIKGRKFLQVIDIPATDDENRTLTYDIEWLAITKIMEELHTNEKTQPPINRDFDYWQRYVISFFIHNCVFTNFLIDKWHLK